MKRDAIDFGRDRVSTLFRRMFVPTLFGMLSICAVTLVDGIFVGQGVGSDGIAAVNICIPLLMVFTGIGLMLGAEGIWLAMPLSEFLTLCCSMALIIRGRMR